MDIRHYFDAVDFTDFAACEAQNWKHTLGAEIEKNTTKTNPEKLGQLKLAIVGTNFNSWETVGKTTGAPQIIRGELYRLAKMGMGDIADFGNLKPASTASGNFKALRDVVDYFNELGIVTVIIGGSQDLSTALCEAFQNEDLFSLSVVDACLDMKKSVEPRRPDNYLSAIFKKKPDIFQFNLIGYQSHHVPAEWLDKVKGLNTHLRLGQLRENMAGAEPVFRNTDVVSFDMGAVKFADSPGTRTVMPNGLRSEEACQLSKYAGLSSRVKAFGLFETVPGNDAHGLTSKLAAQIIWYFMEGFKYRNHENPASGNHSKRFQVAVKDIDKPLVFIHNTKTDQWWMQLETRQNGPVFFACSVEEYALAANNEIPELWLKYIQKLDTTSK